MIVDSTFPGRPLLLLVPLGLLALWRQWLWMAPLMVLTFVAIYVPNTFFLEHYAVVIGPAIILMTLAGVQAAAEQIPAARGSVLCAGVVLAVGFSLNSLHELNPKVDDETFRSPMLGFVHEELAGRVQTPAVVLFRYRQGDPITEEPVYNSDVAWPDDAPVIKAHDLGIRNVEIYRYYAERQPQRSFYLFDRSKLTLELLGTAEQLARSHSQ